jgi:hypothetical protein
MLARQRSISSGVAHGRRSAIRNVALLIDFPGPASISSANPQALARDAPIERYVAALLLARAVFATALADLAQIHVNCFGNHADSIHRFPKQLGKQNV